jgi:isoleucyl-tRNA synthetase
MANTEAEYARIKVGEEVLIMSSRLMPKVMDAAGLTDCHIIETVKGSELKGLEYEHPMLDIFAFQKSLKNAHRVVLSDYVTLEDGTGLVHTAPGHGQEDWKVGQENGLPSVCPVKMDGTFDETCGPYSGIFIKKANPMIIEELRSRGLLLKDGTIEHEYPFCWRCGSALILITVPQWFFRVTEMREKLLKENEKIDWHPKWAKDRFRNWLESLGDWPVSRQRYWGIPLPIWECRICGFVKVIESAKELGGKAKSLHRPEIDSVVLKCMKCKSEMKRVPDVMDVWFDSGVAAWASLGYPSEKKIMKRLWPADLVIEGPDQIRGWWNSMLISGVMTFGESPFRRAIFHGFVLDSHGVKMSKSKGNFVSPEDVISKHGRDAQRCYFLYQVPWEDSYFKWEDVSEIAKSLMVVRNVFNFAKTYVPGTGKQSEMKVEDRWILSRLNSVIASSTESMESFNHHKALREIIDFLLNDFSRWYIKIIRDRVWVGYKGKDREAAFYTIHTVIRESAKLLAPFAPFLSEEMYQNVVIPVKKYKLSVHMEDWPESRANLIDEELEKEMKIAQKIFEASLAARQKAGIKLRWPVRSIVVQSKKKDITSAVKTASEILSSMCNAKIVIVSSKVPKGDFIGNDFDYGTLFLDKEQDEWTRKEAMFRELIRFVQDMRKQNKFNVNEFIRLTISSDTGTLGQLEGYRSAISHEVGAKDVIFGELKGKFSSEMEFEGTKIAVAFDRI